MGFPLIDYEQAPDEVREIFDDIRATRGPGGLSSTWRFFAHDPELLRHWWGLTKRLESGAGEVSERLMHSIAVVCAAEVGCPRCFNTHQSALVDRYGMQPEFAQLLPHFETADEVPAEWKPVLRFAGKVAFGTGLTADDFDELRALGYSDAGIAEIVSIALLESSLAKRSLALVEHETSNSQAGTG